MSATAMVAFGLLGLLVVKLLFGEKLKGLVSFTKDGKPDRDPVPNPTPGDPLIALEDIKENFERLNRQFRELRLEVVEAKAAYYTALKAVAQNASEELKRIGVPDDPSEEKPDEPVA